MTHRPDTDNLEERLRKRTEALLYTLRARGLEVDPDGEHAVHGLAFVLEHGVRDQLQGPRLARRLGLQWREVSRWRRAA